MNDPIISNWESKHEKVFGKQIVHLKHRLHEMEIFSEDYLSSLIERYPKELYELSTMGYDRTVNEWREGDFGGLSGKEVLEAIKKGRMWLDLRRIQDIDPAFGKVIDDVFAEFNERVPGLSTYKHKLGVLISSPNVQVYYHADQPGQSLWQIAGRKTVYVYPNEEPFLSAKDLEGIVMRETQEEVHYETWFDDYAEVIDFGPGEMLHWPLNRPHRVVNQDSMNISLTMEHWTTEVRNAFVVNYANGVMRRYLGMNPTNRKPEGLHVYPKAAFAYAWKKLGMSKGREFVHKVTFRADPKAPNGLVLLTANEQD